MIAGGMVSRLKKGSSCLEESAAGSICLFLSRVVRKSEPRDIPRQTKKRRLKLKALMKNIPKAGAKAKDMLKAR
jgi:hypothetical protein